MACAVEHVISCRLVCVLGASQHALAIIVCHNLLLIQNANTWNNRDLLYNQITVGVFITFCFKTEILM